MQHNMKADAKQTAKPAAGVARSGGTGAPPGADVKEEAKQAVEQLPAPVALTAEQIEELKERAAKADENWDRFLRQAADLENYKKRAARERQEAVTFANEALLQKLIPALDAFEMALAAAKPRPRHPVPPRRHPHGFQPAQVHPGRSRVGGN